MAPTRAAVPCKKPVQEDKNSHATGSAGISGLYRPCQQPAPAHPGKGSDPQKNPIMQIRIGPSEEHVSMANSLTGVVYSIYGMVEKGHARTA